MSVTTCIQTSADIACLPWPPAFFWVFIGIDLLMTAACFAISGMSIYMVRKRSDATLNGIFLIFAAFIFLSGLSHMMTLISVWHPLQWTTGIVQFLTAVVSVSAAAYLAKSLPQTLKMQSRISMQNAIRELEVEILTRISTEESLRSAHDQLESRVQERTAELFNRNQQLYSEIIEYNRVEAALRDTQRVLNSAHRLALSNAGFDRQKISSDLLALLAENHPFSTSALFRAHRHGGSFNCIARHGMPQDGMSAFHFADRMLEKAARFGEIIRLDCTDRTRPPETPSASDKPIVEALIVPVMYQDECLSILVLAGTSRFMHADRVFVESLRVQLGVAQHNLRLYADSKRLASKLHTRNVEIAQKNLQLQDISKMKSDFVANMSHELRTPLNAVLGFTGTLLMRLPGPLTDDQEKQLRTVQSSARHLLSLINDLLNVEKIESGKLDIHLERIVLQTVIREVVDTLQPMAAQKNLECRMALPQANIAIVTDRRALSQILLNLLNNAIKFTDAGHVSIRLSRRRSGDNGTVELVISDTGIGILPEHQSQLFQAFTQLDASSTRRFDGSGLGLYLSRRLAVMAGGQLYCKSDNGKGSVFTLVLPTQNSLGIPALNPGDCHEKSI